MTPVVRIASIVEGRGEVAAVPILLHRIARAVSPYVLVTLPPRRVQRNRIAKEGEVEKAVELAARRRGPGRGGILILLDADDDCPMELAEELLGRAYAARGDQHIRVVLAKREYEAWFLAAARSLADRQDINESTTPPTQPESKRGAKEWLGRQMLTHSSYSPVRDQPELTRHFDMDAARRSARSFDKLWRDVTSLMAAGSSG